MPHRMPLADMAAAIREKRLSSAELIEAHLARISEITPRINAFVRVCEEEARAAARIADSTARRGPLHGVPVTIKDSFDVEGLPTLCGSNLRLGHSAVRDSTAVARLRAAGAIILGKTNCPEFLANYESDNYIAGRTNHPLDPDRTAGGSSGGEAAAIASYCSPGGIGSDGGGSIRVPAHFCGIAGLKPTPGRISGAGHVPAINHPGGLLGVAGPMARNARDVKFLFEVLAGYDPADPFSAPVPLRSPEAKALRIGVLERFYDVPVQPAIAAAVRRAADRASSHGWRVDVFRPRGLERAPNLWGFFFDELVAVAKRDLFDGREADLHWTGTEFFDRWKDKPPPSAKQILDNLAARDSMRASLLDQMRDVDLVIAPVCAMPAFRHRERRWETNGKAIGLFQAMMPSTWVNLLGLPSLAISMSRSPEGLPIGVQLVGRPWEEELLLEVGIALEEG
jgi:amidase